MRKALEQFVVRGGAGELDRVVLLVVPQSPPVQDHEYERAAVHPAHQRPASCRMAERPAYFAAPPSSSSMRSNWLYFATRSVRLAEPVLIWPALVATARSAIVTSSVSPDRCDTMQA